MTSALVNAIESLSISSAACGMCKHSLERKLSLLISVATEFGCPSALFFDEEISEENPL
jgi:hypothetical protein